MKFVEDFCKHYKNNKKIKDYDLKEIDEKLTNINGYKLETPISTACFSGYIDWFTKTFKKTGFAIDVGCGAHSLSISQFDELYDDVLGMLLLACAVIV